MSLARQFGIAGTPPTMALPVISRVTTAKPGTEPKPVTRDVTDGKTREVRYVDQAMFDAQIAALKAEIAGLRTLIGKSGEGVKPNGRATYMREYRKRHPKKAAAK